VVSLLVVDVTNTSTLVSTLRTMSEQRMAPRVAVWHMGYNNILIESITHGKAPLPYIGVPSSDLGSVFGTTAAERLPSSSQTSLCAEAESSHATSSLISSECSHFFAGRGEISPSSSVVVCRDTLTIPQDVGAIWATKGCCEHVVSAVFSERNEREILVGCHGDDEDSRSSGMANVVLRHPIRFQALMAASWSIAAVQDISRGGTGRYAFPTMGTVVATELEPMLSLQ